MLHVAGSFLHSDHEIKAASAIAKLKEFMNSAYLANFMAVVVLVDAYCTCRDIDATAAQEQAPEILNIISDLCLAACRTSFELVFCFPLVIYLTWPLVRSGSRRLFRALPGPSCRLLIMINTTSLWDCKASSHILRSSFNIYDMIYTTLYDLINVIKTKMNQESLSLL